MGGGGGGKGSGAGKTDHHLRHRRRAVITPNHRTLPVPISSSPEARTFSLSAKWWRARPQARVGGWVRGCVGGGGRRGCQSQERRTGHGMLHTPSTAFRHLPPNSARFGYASEGALSVYLRGSSICRHVSYDVVLTCGRCTFVKVCMQVYEDGSEVYSVCGGVLGKFLCTERIKLYCCSSLKRLTLFRSPGL